MQGHECKLNFQYPQSLCMKIRYFIHWHSVHRGIVVEEFYVTEGGKHENELFNGSAKPLWYI